LTHSEEMFLRASPSSKLTEVTHRFMQLKDEFKRNMDYKVERFSVQLPEVKRHYGQAIALRLQDKQHYLDVINEKLKMSNPKLQCHKGWAQVSYAGKTVMLEDIGVGEQFILEDDTMQIEALCVDKKKT